MIEFEQTELPFDGSSNTPNGLRASNRKAALGQFMTPAHVARFMASLFSREGGAVRLLDAGAGIGSLATAFVDRWGADGVHLTAYEIDEMLISRLCQRLADYRDTGFETTVIDRDFITDAVDRIRFRERESVFTHAILNPPYRKISSDSTQRASLRKVGLETVNLYSAFVGLAIELMAPGGQIVAIIPRSFCNGPYYKPFREWVLRRAALEHIHLFHSRTSAFSEDGVLQENVIIKIVRGKRQGNVVVSTSSDRSFADLQSHEYSFAEIVQYNDAQKFIHVPTTPAHGSLRDVPLADRSLDEIGLAVSTGPVVDFRLKQFLRERPGQGDIPLLYPAHFSSGSLVWPRQSKKPNALLDRPETRKWLYPNGFYTVVRRFSSKEERRRVVANVVEPTAFNAPYLGFENHLNVFHSDKRGIDRDTAYGLSAFLNSRAVDEYFRRFSGHTQVNATDLRVLLYPELTEIRQLGRWVQRSGRLAQERIDARLEAMHDGRNEDR